MITISKAKDVIKPQMLINPANITTLKLSFIKKTKARDPKNKLFPNFVKLGSEMEDHLKTVIAEDIKTKWENIENGNIKLRKFNLDDFTPDDYGLVEKDQLPSFDSLIEKIRQENESEIEDLKNMSDAKSFCVEIFDSSNNINIIVFATIKYSSIKSKDDVASKMSSRKLERIDKDIVVFSKNIDSIYFVDGELHILFDERATEKSFGLDEYYENKSKEIILELSPELIDTTFEFLERNLTNKKLQRDIVKMYTNNQFDKTILNYKEHKKLFNKYNDLDPKLTQVDITEDDKIKIDTKEKLETFVHMSKHDILQNPLGEKGLYIVYGKRSMKKQ